MSHSAAVDLQVAEDLHMPPRPSARACHALGAAAFALALLGAGLATVSGGSAPAQAAEQASIRVTDSRGAEPQRQAPAQQASAIDQRLQDRIAAKMSHATARHYGFVVDIAGVGRVVSLGPDRALRPASTQKLFTTLPLLLGRPGRQLVTAVAVHAKPVNGVVHGNLVVRASADPSFTHADVNSLARQVFAAGIHRVTGKLRLDIGSLPLHSRQSGWKADFVPADIGPLSPFPIDQDSWRTDAAYLAHPTKGNLRKFRNRLAAHGVHVAGASEVVRGSPGAGVVVAIHRAAALRAIIKHTLRQSDNFYAESLLAVAGGHAAVNRMESDAHITGTSIATDGSGLSYDDRETAQGEVRLLHYAHAGPAAADLKAALPVGCRSGTLKDRFCGTIGAGTVFAKTGTLTHSRALSGYTTDARGRLVTFSVICGGVRNLTAAAQAMDKAVLVLRAFSR
jgi:D-alanyl-D-alanine carboxypeptidase/D-alanyl-D-alanine-endopeptidase (penicillin-binding protein 4)